MGQSSLPKWVPGTIEFIGAGWITLKPHHKIIPSQNHFVPDHIFAPKRSPAQNFDPTLQNLPRGRFWELSKSLQKERTAIFREILSRIHPSKLQTKPRGEKQFFVILSCKNPKFCVRNQTFTHYFFPPPPVVRYSFSLASAPASEPRALHFSRYLQQHSSAAAYSNSSSIQQQHAAADACSTSTSTQLHSSMQQHHSSISSSMPLLCLASCLLAPPASPPPAWPPLARLLPASLPLPPGPCRLGLLRLASCSRNLVFYGTRPLP